MEGRIEFALAVWRAIAPYVVMLVIALALYAVWA
jgi:hypothetical protein